MFYSTIVSFRHKVFVVIALLCVAFAAGTALMPAVSFASGSCTDGGLLTCGCKVGIDSSGSTITYKNECTVCDFGRILMNVLTFFILISVVVAALLFVNAGMLYVSGGSTPAKISKAHRVFTHAAVGMVIILAAYLAIDTVVKTVVQNSTGDVLSYGPWNQILCTNYSDTNTFQKIDQITLAAGKAVDPVPHVAGGGYTAMDYQYDSKLQTYVLTDQAYVAGAARLRDPTQCSVNGQSCYDYIAAQAAAKGVDPNFAIAIATIESAGKTGVVSSAGAVGLMQLMPGTARLMCGSSCSSMSDAEMTTWLKDPVNNVNAGLTYLQQGMNSSRVQELSAGDTQKTFEYTAAYYNGGPKALTASKTCPGQTYFECTANNGYAETRGYVAKMTTEMNTPL